MREIAPASLEEIPQLARLLGELFRQEADFEPAYARQERGLRMIIESPEVGQILVLRESGKVMGMVNLLFTVSTAEGGWVAVLEDLIVDVAARGRGAGRELLEAAILCAHNRGCSRVTLLTDMANVTARRFYARRGFKESAMIPMRLYLEV